MITELTAQEKIFVEAYVETNSALEAAKRAYPNASFRSQQTLAHAVLNRAKVQNAIVSKRGAETVFSKEYLLLQLKDIIESPKGNGAAKVAAIRIAAEIAGHLARETGKLRPKSRAEELGELPTSLRDLAQRVTEYRNEKPS